MPELITQAELARREGVNRMQVTKWKKDGRLVWRKKKIDYEATKKLLDETADPARAEFAKSGGRVKVSFADARTAKEAARARLTQLQVKEKEGQLVDRDALLFSLQDLFANIKSQELSIPAKTVGEIVGVLEKDLNIKVPQALQVKLRTIIQGEIRDTLKELSKWKPTTSS